MTSLLLTPMCVMFKGDKSSPNLHNNNAPNEGQLLSFTVPMNVKTYIIPLQGLETCEKDQEQTFPAACIITYLLNLNIDLILTRNKLLRGG